MPVLHACPGCGAAKAGTGRCTRCARPTNQRKNQRTTVKGVYNTARWRTIRARVLERDDNECATPGCYAYANTVDHIEPFTSADDPLAWDEANLQSMCAHHHGQKDATRQARSTHG
jgi:5-methylcytosine-specific restriction endonuclease McrA